MNALWVPAHRHLAGRSLCALALLAAQALVPAQATEQAAPKAPAKAAQAQARARKSMTPATQKTVEERVPVEDEPTHDLSPAEMELARAVHVGRMACELGASVTVAPAKREGFFVLSTSQGQKFRMHPTESRTGALRLEDPKRGAMWLQLGNKSMLMSQKLGQRLADECQSPAQVAVAEAMKKNPPPSLLDAAPANPAAAAAAK